MLNDECRLQAYGLFLDVSRSVDGNRLRGEDASKRSQRARRALTRDAHGYLESTTPPVHATHMRLVALDPRRLR